MLHSILKILWNVKHKFGKHKGGFSPLSQKNINITFTKFKEHIFIFKNLCLIFYKKNSVFNFKKIIFNFLFLFILLNY